MTGHCIGPAAAFDVQKSVCDLCMVICQITDKKLDRSAKSALYEVVNHIQ